MAQSTIWGAENTPRGPWGALRRNAIDEPSNKHRFIALNNRSNIADKKRAQRAKEMGRRLASRQIGIHSGGPRKKNRSRHKQSVIPQSLTAVVPAVVMPETLGEREENEGVSAAGEGGSTSWRISAACPGGGVAGSVTEAPW